MEPNSTKELLSKEPSEYKVKCKSVSEREEGDTSWRGQQVIGVSSNKFHHFCDYQTDKSELTPDAVRSWKSLNCCDNSYHNHFGTTTWQFEGHFG